MKKPKKQSFFASQGKEVIVNDNKQKDYRYTLTEPVGKNYPPEFAPDLTPKNMLNLGVFGGAYLDSQSKEFPVEWFLNAKLSLKENDPALNFFGVKASQPLRVWQQKGWIHPDDPRGWFQWYCRFYMGRRHEDDERQIKRWVAMKRHVAQIKQNCTPGDVHCRPKQRQALLHWAYDSRKL